MSLSESNYCARLKRRAQKALKENHNLHPGLELISQYSNFFLMLNFDSKFKHSN